jgi:hypothetical protein
MAGEPMISQAIPGWRALVDSARRVPVLKVRHLSGYQHLFVRNHRVGARNETPNLDASSFSNYERIGKMLVGAVGIELPPVVQNT